MKQSEILQVNFRIRLKSGKTLSEVVVVDTISKENFSITAFRKLVSIVEVKKSVYFHEEVVSINLIEFKELKTFDYSRKSSRTKAKKPPKLTNRGDKDGKK